MSREYDNDYHITIKKREKKIEKIDKKDKKKSEEKSIGKKKKVTFNDEDEYDSAPEVEDAAMADDILNDLDEGDAEIASTKKQFEELVDERIPYNPFAERDMEFAQLTEKERAKAWEAAQKAPRANPEEIRKKRAELNAKAQELAEARSKLERAKTDEKRQKRQKMVYKLELELETAERALAYANGENVSDSEDSSEESSSEDEVVNAREADNLKVVDRQLYQLMQSKQRITERMAEKERLQKEKLNVERKKHGKSENTNDIPDAAAIKQRGREPKPTNSRGIKVSKRK